MTATLIATFVEDGTISWNSRLSKIYRAPNSIHSDYLDVTIEMLLAHRAGLTADLPSYNGGQLWQKLLDENLDPVDGRAMVSKTLLSETPSTMPGSQFRYSNAGYIILGAVVEKLTGKSWEDLLVERVFKPLKMNSCGFGPPGTPDASIPDQPWPHRQSANGPEPVAPSFYADNPPTLGPAGNVHCSLSDWSKFTHSHVEGFNGKNNILKASTYKPLHTKYPGQDYTFGGWVRLERNWANGPVLVHSGSNTLNYAVVWLAPKLNSGFLSVTNYAGSDSGANATDEVIGALLNGQ